MPRGFLAYNPAAGRFPSRLLSERAANVLRDYGWEIQLEQTRDGEHIRELAHMAGVEKMDAFFMAGGDGSLNHAIRGLIGTEVSLGVLPAGTANVWAQELGLPGLAWTRWMALEESAHRLAVAKVVEIDIGMCNGHPFLLWGGVGLDGFIVHRIEPRARWEKHFSVVHYAASAAWHASFWHGINLRVEADGQKISGHFLLALISNVHLYAGGIAELTPDARLDDGLLDLWLVEGETLGNTVQLAWELFAGRLVEDSKVQHIPVRQVLLESDSPMYVQLDAEPVTADGQVLMEVRPRALRVLIPEHTPHPLLVNGK